MNSPNFASRNHSRAGLVQGPAIQGLLVGGEAQQQPARRTGQECERVDVKYSGRR